MTATKTTSAPSNPYTSVPVYTSNHVDPAPVPKITTNTVAPALLPETTTVPANRPTNVSHEPDPKIFTTFPTNPPTPVLPVPNTTTTTCVYANPHTQNYPVIDTTPPPTPIAPVPDTPSPTKSTPTVVADFHGVKWYDSKYLIDLDEVPSLQWKFTNQFFDQAYCNSGVWMYMIDSLFVMYGKKICLFL